MGPEVELELPMPPLVEWCVQRDFGHAAGCVWVLARSESEARRRADPVLRGVFPTSAPAGPVGEAGVARAFPRAEYRERQGPRDFTAGVRLEAPRTAR